MQSRVYFIVMLLALSTALAGCEIVGGIFKAGLWAGIILVVLIVGLVMWLMSKFRSKG